MRLICDRVRRIFFFYFFKFVVQLSSHTHELEFDTQAQKKIGWNKKQIQINQQIFVVVVINCLKKIVNLLVEKKKYCSVKILHYTHF